MAGNVAYLEGLLDAVDNFIKKCHSSIEEMISVKSDISDNRTGCNVGQTVGTVLNTAGSVAVALGLLFPSATIVGAAALVVGSPTNITAHVVRDKRNRCE